MSATATVAATAFVDASTGLEPRVLPCAVDDIWLLPDTPDLEVTRSGDRNRVTPVCWARILSVAPDRQTCVAEPLLYDTKEAWSVATWWWKGARRVASGAQWNKWLATLPVASEEAVPSIVSALYATMEWELPTRFMLEDHRILAAALMACAERILMHRVARNNSGAAADQTNQSRTCHIAIGGLEAEDMEVVMFLFQTQWRLSGWNYCPVNGGLETALTFLF